MNDFAMDGGEVYSGVVEDPAPAYQFTNDPDSGMYYSNTTGSTSTTFTVTTSGGTTGDQVWIKAIGDTLQFALNDPIEEMKSTVSRLAEGFLEKHR